MYIEITYKKLAIGCAKSHPELVIKALGITEEELFELVNNPEKLSEEQVTAILKIETPEVEQKHSNLYDRFSIMLEPVFMGIRRDPSIVSAKLRISEGELLDKANHPSDLEDLEVCDILEAAGYAHLADIHRSSFTAQQRAEYDDRKRNYLEGKQQVGAYLEQKHIWDDFLFQCINKAIFWVSDVEQVVALVPNDFRGTKDELIEYLLKELSKKDAQTRANSAVKDEAPSSTSKEFLNEAIEKASEQKEVFSGETMVTPTIKVNPVLAAYFTVKGYPEENWYEAVNHIVSMIPTAHRIQYDKKADIAATQYLPLVIDMLGNDSLEWIKQNPTEYKNGDSTHIIR